MMTNYVYYTNQACKFPIKAWTKGVPFEEEAQEQVFNVASLPFIHSHVAIMPDVHKGLGATIGSVIPTVGAIVPSTIGVDIGCGILAVQTTMTASDLPESLKTVRSLIEKAVPHGRTDNGGKGDKGGWKGRPPTRVAEAWSTMSDRFKKIVNKHPKIASSNNVNHLGTLGTGNHFIEVCLDQEDRVWFMLHSGSRGVGNRIGSYFIRKAKEDMKRWFIDLPDKDLAYFPEGTDHFYDYAESMRWAQDFAMKNRETMMAAVVEELQSSSVLPPFDLQGEAVNCHHNFAAFERHFGKDIWVTRKGAVRARRGDMAVIPGSMGARSYIVRGLGNRESFNSCSHGAGRAMSRTEAKKRFTVDQHEAATSGVECRKDAGVLDETPMAYKNIDDVMEAQKDLVEAVHQLRQVVCVKG